MNKTVCEISIASKFFNPCKCLMKLVPFSPSFTIPITMAFTSILFHLIPFYSISFTKICSTQTLLAQNCFYTPQETPPGLHNPTRPNITRIQGSKGQPQERKNMRYSVKVVGKVNQG